MFCNFDSKFPTIFDYVNQRSGAMRWTSTTKAGGLDSIAGGVILKIFETVPVVCPDT